MQQSFKLAYPKQDLPSPHCEEERVKLEIMTFARRNRTDKGLNLDVDQVKLLFNHNQSICLSEANLQLSQVPQ